MICVNDLNKYAHIVFYGLMKKKIDEYLCYIETDKCLIIDSDYRKLGEVYRGIKVVSIDEIIAMPSDSYAVIILPISDEQNIYKTIRKNRIEADIYADDVIFKGNDLESWRHEENGRYTIEKHIQILISLLKEHGIRNIIVSPGICNLSFVNSINSDSYFNIISCIDERSAAYMACGIAESTGTPVVLSCTGATASRNYMPALTEAYYSKLPILAITSSRESFRIGNGIDQVTDRRFLPRDIAIHSVEISPVNNETEKKYCKLQINRAICLLTMGKGGPVHINLTRTGIMDFSSRALPGCYKIDCIEDDDMLPVIPGDSALLIKPNVKVDDEIRCLLREFSVRYNVPVIGDCLSCSDGIDYINVGLLSEQSNSDLVTFNRLIIVGEISRSSSLTCKRSWRISEDYRIEDTYLNLEYHFNMSLKAFLLKYLAMDTAIGNSSTEFADKLRDTSERLFSAIPDTPFSNFWIARNTVDRIPENTNLYLGIFSSLKYWSLFYLPRNTRCFSMVGGFGIDGTISAAIGSSIVCREKLHMIVLGDLAFFYDMNSLGNKHVGNNLRILVVNNDGGSSLAVDNIDTAPESVSEYAAYGHYRQDGFIENYAKTLGFTYYYADTKEDYLNQLPLFLDKASSVSAIFEVKTTQDSEMEAAQMIRKIL